VRRAAIVLLAALGLACGGPAIDAPMVRVRIPAGASLVAVADSLSAHGVLEHPGWFRFLARARGKATSLQAGTYDFRRGERASHVLEAMLSGRTASRRFTVPEGLALADLAQLAEEELGIPADTLVATATALAEDGILPDAEGSLEGFLYPETYLLPVDVTAEELLRRLVDGFRQAWDSSWTPRLDTLGLTRREVVNLAAIVEGEALVDRERETIAGVYHNRLRIGMPLQADPTVQYAIQQATGSRKPRLLLKDYQFDSPWNTYLNPGLPPGPIASPGARSIRATLYPAKVPYLFFVIAGMGTVIASRRAYET